MDKTLTALDLIAEHGGGHGADHKQWLLDQVVRILAVGDYDLWVEQYHQENPGGWDTGTAPIQGD